MRRNFGDNLYHAHTTRSKVAIVTLEGDTSRKVVRRCVQHGLFVLEQELEEKLFNKLAYVSLTGWNVTVA